jgi:AcrR family transcriptional regulator
MTAARPRGITVDDIVLAGVAIAAEEGLPAVTVRAVAHRLGVRSPSLYHHLPGGVEELRSLVVQEIQQILEAANPVPSDASLAQRLEAQLRLVGQATVAYPGVLEHILTVGRDGPTTLSGSDRTVALLLESELAGIAPGAYVAVHAYVTGWVFAQRPSSTAAADHGMPVLAHLLREAERLDQQQVLLDGLRALLAGLAVQQEATPAPRRRAPRKRRS